MLKNVLKLLKEDMQKSIISISEKYSHTYTCNCINVFVFQYYITTFSKS